MTRERLPAYNRLYACSTSAPRARDAARPPVPALLGLPICSPPARR